MLKLSIITPRRKVLEKEIKAITAPGAEGEITILPRHEELFTLLKEGILKIKRKDDKEDYFAIGGGYLETDGIEVNVLVSRAYGEKEVTEEMIRDSEERAKKILSETKDKKERAFAFSLLRKSVIDKKLLKRRKRRQ